MSGPIRPALAATLSLCRVQLAACNCPAGCTACIFICHRSIPTNIAKLAMFLSHHHAHCMTLLCRYEAVLPLASPEFPAPPPAQLTVLPGPVAAWDQDLGLNASLVYSLASQQVQHRAVQHSTVQCSTVQYSTVHYRTVQNSTLQYTTVQYSTVKYTTIQYSTVQYSTVQYSTV